MKQTRLHLFGTLAMAALLASCASLDKMKEVAKQVNYKVNPDPLEAHQGKVAMEFTANVPAKVWNKKVSATLTPVLKAQDGTEYAYPSMTIQGEAVQGNGQTVSYVNPTTIKYAKQEIDFNDKQRVSDLIVKISFKMGDKTMDISSPELDMPALAHGVIATSGLISEQPGVPVASKDAYVRTTTEDQVAEILFLINQSNIRNGELSKDDVKAINDYIKALNEDERKNIKSISVSAYASPDGSTDLNTKLAGNRESAAKKYVDGVLKKAKAEAGEVVTQNTPEDWSGFRKAIETSDIQDKQLILSLYDRFFASDPEILEKEIKNLSALYKTLAKDILPGLRRSAITVTGEIIGRSDDEIKAANLDDLSLEELLYRAKLADNKGADAKAALDKAMSKFANDYRAFNNKGVILYEEGDVDGAKKLFAQAEGVKAAPEVENNLGVVALAQGDVQAAKECFGKAAGVGADLNENLGIAAIFDGDYDKAESYFGNSTSNNAALVKILNGKYEAALSALEANKAENSLKYYLKAIANARKDVKDAALENLSKATKLDSKWKSYAKTDMEFYKYFNDSNFKSIVE